MFVVVKDFSSVQDSLYGDFLPHGVENPEQRFPSNLRVFSAMSNLEAAALTSGFLTMNDQTKVLFVDLSDNLYT